MPNETNETDATETDGSALALRSDACAGCGDAPDAGETFPALPDGTADRCAECARADGWNQCERDACGAWSDDARATEGDGGGYLCPPCFASNAFVCDACETAWTNRDGTYTVGDESWCRGCRDEHSRACDACGDRFDTREGSYNACNDCSRVTCEGCDPCTCSEDSENDTPSNPVTYRARAVASVPSIDETIRFGMEIECRMPSFPNDWSAKHDGSLSRRGEYETVSPILQGTAGVARLAGAVAKMEREGCGTAGNGGIHVHVSRAGRAWTVQDAYRVVSHWSAWGEDLASYIVPGFRLGSGARAYNAPLGGRNGDGEHVARNIADAVASGSTRWTSGASDVSHACGTRYRALNLEALDKYGTFEIRIFPSVVRADSATLYASFVARFVAFAVATDPARVAPSVARFGAGRFGLSVLSRCGSGASFRALALREWERVKPGTGQCVTGQDASTSDGPSTHHESGRDPFGAKRRAALVNASRTMLPFGRVVVADVAERDARPAPVVVPDASETERVAYRADCGAGFTYAEIDSGACVMAGTCPLSHACRVARNGPHASALRPSAESPETWGRIRAGCYCASCDSARSARDRQVRRAVVASASARGSSRIARAYLRLPVTRALALERAATRVAPRGGTVDRDALHGNRVAWRRSSDVTYGPDACGTACVARPHGCAEEGRRCHCGCGSIVDRATFPESAPRRAVGLPADAWNAFRSPAPQYPAPLPQ